ncbi:sensor histidine kinase [Parabacteroides distasonis]|nr:HAMP domain-containing sensor histidine kinase [Parabacteroides distasonis]MDB9041587.1 HAMP domain-containing sensor histidine kinase [Parabacteroides distasonis]MDB9091901.1 HAMP domain-containing sensor histidine kinase [Parabacteroides distasonis]MDB9159796.1 HAMP domain-containing sensor histidine kinase [Parabacteroides distasonis]
MECVLAKMPSGDRLVKLDELASDKGQGLDYKYYADRLLKEAELSKDDTYKGNALFQIIRYYYSRNIDSMHFFIKKAEPIYLAQKRYEDLCRVKGWYIYALSSNGEKERVLENVQALKDLSSELDFPDGIDMANQALADFYFSTGFDAEGIALYEEVFLDMEKRDSPLAKRITVIRHLQNENIQASKRLFYLKKLKEYIVECEEKGIEELDEDTPLYYVKYLYHRSYALLGIDKKDVSLTSYHLARAEKLVKDCNMRNEYLSISNIRLLYYRISGDYERGKALANELIDYCLQRKRAVSVLGLMKDKAIICYNSGHGMEAADAYREYISLKDSVTNAAFYNDLANLRARHDVDKLELANKKMELEAAHSRTKLLVMGGGLVLLLLVCCSLGYISYSRHKYGLQLKQAKDKAEEADRLKSAFLANMNHEIRTPLNAIVGFSQVLVDEEDRETRQEFADIIQNNNELLQRLIADVLDLSKIESNSMPLIYKDQDIPTLMKEIYSMILLRMHEGVELELYDCEELVMETDRNRLTQILTNLLTNAIKHTQEGSIRFGYKRSALSVEFFVQDSGEGIPEDKIDTIFSRFVQLDNWSKGVGLGLAICQGLVEQMGGNIRVTSRVGEGSVFYVTLPLIRPRISS